MLLNAVKKNLSLTLPILLTRMFGITSNLIAMILIAHLGTEALSAGALVMGIFSVCVLLVMSFSFSVCAVVAEQCGRNADFKVGSIISASILLNTILAIPFMVIFYYITPILIWLGQPHQVSYLVGSYFYGLLFGYLPMIWAGILEQFLVGIGKPRYILYLSIIGLIIMPLLSNALIFGRYGFSAYGMWGAGFAVSVTSTISFIVLLAFILFKKWHVKYHLSSLRDGFDFSLIKKLYQLGWPIALQFSGEFLAYTLITLMMGWLGVMVLAAQQIILQFTTVVVMIPTSVAQATAVLVGQAQGSNNNELIRYQVNISVVIIVMMMVLVGCVYIFIPDVLIRFYLDIDNPINKPIQYLAISLLSITALSQCFDGVRNVLSGAYRGLQQTKIPMIIGTVSLWLVGIPMAYYYGFILHEGAQGVRWGFTVGVALSMLLLAISWYQPFNNPHKLDHDNCLATEG